MGMGWSTHAGDGGSPRLPSSPARTRQPTTSSIAAHQRPSGGFAFDPLPHTNALLPATRARTGELSSPSWAPSCWPSIRRIGSRGPVTSCTTGLVHENGTVDQVKGIVKILNAGQIASPGVFAGAHDGRQAVGVTDLLLPAVFPDHFPELLLPLTLLNFGCCPLLLLVPPDARVEPAPPC